ncbi:MAG: HEAT repeat domain-containing protein [Planctomycetia bacterium]
MPLRHPLRTALRAALRAARRSALRVPSAAPRPGRRSAPAALLPAARLPAARLPAAALLAAALLLGGPGAPAARAEDAPSAMEQARAAKLRDLRRDVRKWAQGPWAAEHEDDLLKALSALEALGGLPAAQAAIEALHVQDADVRDRACALVDGVHDPSLVAALGALLVDKDLRRDTDLRLRVARSLGVQGLVEAIPHLVLLVQDEPATVVAAACTSLAAFGQAPTALKREAVRRMVDIYESTWNLMNSVRPEDRLLAKVAYEDWEVFHKPMREALRKLTLQALTYPKDWRRWWNDHKKDREWKPGAPAPAGLPK